MPVESNVIDRLVQYVAPEWALRRAAARELLSVGGYTGASRRRRQTQNFNPRLGSPDADVLPDLEDLRARGRHLTRNNPHAAGAVNTTTDNAVSEGLVPQSQPDGEYLGLNQAEVRQIQKTAERHFAWWAQNKSWCDLTKTENFAEMQDTVLRSKLDSGDTFVLRRRRTDPSRPFGLALEMFEADRIYNPSGIQDGGEDKKGRRYSGGVEFDNDGAPVAYHVGEHHPGDLRRQKVEPMRVKAFSVSGQRRMLHLMSRTRPGQSRGVPYVAGIIEPAHMFDRFEEATLMNAAVSAMFTAFIQTKDGVGLDTGDPLGLGISQAGESNKKRGQMAPAAIVELFAGETVEFADPKSPSANFAAFETAVVRQMAIMLNLPYETLTKHYQSSYSAARAAMLDAWNFFRRVRKFLVDGLCQPVWEWFFEELVILGIIRAPGFFDDPLIRAAYTQATWSGQARPQIDSLKEIKASRERVAGNVSNLTDETAMLTGKDWESVMRRKAAEIRLLEELGLPVPPELRGEDASSAPEPEPDPPPGLEDDPDAADEAENAGTEPPSGSELEAAA